MTRWRKLIASANFKKLLIYIEFAAPARASHSKHFENNARKAKCDGAGRARKKNLLELRKRSSEK